MFLSQLNEEQRYRYHERIGIMCADQKPNADQEFIAMTEAMACVEDTEPQRVFRQWVQD